MPSKIRFANFGEIDKMAKNPNTEDKTGGKKSGLLLTLILPSAIIALMMLILFIVFLRSHTALPTVLSIKTNSDEWTAPDTNSLGNSEEDRLIKYGRQLIANTSFYLGPKGTVQHITNGMNCQNCHLNAGTKYFGNNYSAVASTYPKFRARSGTVEDVYKRVNDCIQRSLNGTALDTASKEMQAIKAYIMWLGKDVKKGTKPKGSGITDLAYLERPADAENGKMVYAEKCQTCHGPNGEGKQNKDTISYPPLWGKNSYNIGAGLYRLSRFAGYVKSNMPFGTNHDDPKLSDEEAWDVAAFVNSQPRPLKDLSSDWPKITGKPVDHPFGPYADSFSEKQHKYGPFGPIAAAKKAREKEKSKTKAGS
jgi:thiosulfate dehydrogenase